MAYGKHQMTIWIKRKKSPARQWGEGEKLSTLLPPSPYFPSPARSFPAQLNPPFPTPARSFPPATCPHSPLSQPFSATALPSPIQPDLLTHTPPFLTPSPLLPPHPTYFTKKNKKIRSIAFLFLFLGKWWSYIIVLRMMDLDH